MQALTFHGNENIKVESVPDPAIKSQDDVIVQVKLCAICGSDLHVYHGREKGLDHGTVMGHEFMGTVVDTGKNVKTIRKGDRVMSPFSSNCGNCFYCKLGLTSRCTQSQLFGWLENGEGLNGGQAELVRVPLADSTLLTVPEEISDEEALLLGDIIPTGFFCARQAEVSRHGQYAVIGSGPVGLMTVLGALQSNCEKIYVIDRVRERLDMAAKLGGIPIDASTCDPVERIKELTERRGVDSVMEAVGSKETSRLAYDIVRPGGIISMVGVCTDKHMSFSLEEAYNKNLTFKVGRCPARRLMPELVPIVSARRFDFTSIVSHRMPLQQGAVGYQLFANKIDNCLKVVLH